MRVPFVDLVAQQAEIAEEMLPLWRRILEDATFVGGEQVERFERDIASFTGVRHCVGVANGTDAIELAFQEYVAEQLRGFGCPSAAVTSQYRTEGPL
jgi:dTDP-4-amino-4,6-dideoxygalactose transaminase